MCERDDRKVLSFAYALAYEALTMKCSLYVRRSQRVSADSMLVIDINCDSDTMGGTSRGNGRNAIEQGEHPKLLFHFR